MKLAAAKLAVLCAMTLSAGSAVAEENLSLFTLGALSCSDWNRPPDFANSGLKHWMMRYGARLGADYKRNVFDESPPGAALTWIDAYCKAHPLDGLSAAGVALMNDLARRM